MYTLDTSTNKLESDLAEYRRELEEFLRLTRSMFQQIRETATVEEAAPKRKSWDEQAKTGLDAFSGVLGPILAALDGGKKTTETAGVAAVAVQTNAVAAAAEELNITYERQARTMQKVATAGTGMATVTETFGEVIEKVTVGKRAAVSTESSSSMVAVAAETSKTTTDAFDGVAKAAAVLQKGCLVAQTAIAGWEFGKWISEVTGLKGALVDFFSESWSGTKASEWEKQNEEAIRQLRERQKAEEEAMRKKAEKERQEEQVRQKTQQAADSYSRAKWNFDYNQLEAPQEKLKMVQGKLNELDQAATDAAAKGDQAEAIRIEEEKLSYDRERLGLEKQIRQQQEEASRKLTEERRNWLEQQGNVEARRLEDKNLRDIDQISRTDPERAANRLATLQKEAAEATRKAAEEYDVAAGNANISQEKREQLHRNYNEAVATEDRYTQAASDLETRRREREAQQTQAVGTFAAASMAQMMGGGETEKEIAKSAKNIDKKMNKVKPAYPAS